MARRHLSSDEQAIWKALTHSVRPLRPVPAPAKVSGAPMTHPAERKVMPAPSRPVGAAPTRTAVPVPIPTPAPVPGPVPVLDNSWERRVRGGTLTPDMTIDLHGHSLSSAHVRLNHALSAALAHDQRILLIITGKPPKAPALNQQSRRGAIRGEIGHWLETSPFADRIASVRQAHPRHGGDGALYVILRRKK